MAEAPSFIERDPDKIVSEMVADLEARLDKTLYPAQVERLLIDFIAYRELLTREAMQDAAAQNLVQFAREPMLAELAAQADVPRVQAQPAEAMVRLTFSQPLSQPHTLPAGWQLATASGVRFVTRDAIALLPGANAADIRVFAQLPGADGNGLPIGAIDRADTAAGLPLASVSSVTVTAGGADVEDVERWRRRIMSAPDRYSWGSEGRYRELALSVAPDLLDVRVFSPASDGCIDVILLGANGPPDDVVVRRVSELLGSSKGRMLGDRVSVKAAQAVDYAIAVTVDVLSRHVPDLVLSVVRDRLTSWVAQRGRRLGGDIVPGQIRAAIGAVDGLYDLQLPVPAATRVLAQHEWPNCTALTVQLGRVVGDA